MEDVKVSTFGQMQAETTTETTAAATTEAGQNQNDNTTAVAAQENTETTTTATQEQASAFDFELPDLPSGDTPAAEGQQQQAAPATPSWKEAIKTADRSELLRELGLTDFAIQLNDHLTKGGSAEDYLHAKAVDWNKVPDAELLKQQLKAEFPNAKQEQIDRFFNKRYTQGDLHDAEENEDGLLLIEADARKARSQRIEQQAKFKLPEPPAQQQPQQQTFEIPPEVQKYADGFFKSKVLEEVQHNKRVDIPLPDGTVFKFGLQRPELIRELVMNPELQRKLNMTQSGEPDVQLITQKALFQLYPQQYTEQIYKAGMEAYKRKMIAEGQNIGVQKQPSGGSDVVPFNQAWRGAKVTTYGG